MMVTERILQTKWLLGIGNVQDKAEQIQRHNRLRQDLDDCLASMAKNETMFNLEVESDLVEARIYERRALQCRYHYLLKQARQMGLGMQRGQ